MESLDSTLLPAAGRASPVAVVVFPAGLLFFPAGPMFIPAGPLFVPAGPMLFPAGPLFPLFIPVGPMSFVRELPQFGRHVGQGLPPFVLMPIRGSKGIRGKNHSLGETVSLSCATLQSAGVLWTPSLPLQRPLIGTENGWPEGNLFKMSCCSPPSSPPLDIHSLGPSESNAGLVLRLRGGGSDCEDPKPIFGGGGTRIGEVRRSTLVLRPRLRGGGLGEDPNLAQAPGLWANLSGVPGLPAGLPPTLGDPPVTGDPLSSEVLFGTEQGYEARSAEMESFSPQGYEARSAEMEFFSPQGYETRSAELQFYGIHMDQARSAEEKFPKKH